MIILSGNGKAFCAGIDLNDLMALGSVVNDDELDTARKSIKLLTVIKKFQNHHMEIEKVSQSLTGYRKRTAQILRATHFYDLLM